MSNDRTDGEMTAAQESAFERVWTCFSREQTAAIREFVRAELAAFAERMPHPMEKIGPRPARDLFKAPTISDEAMDRLRESLEATTAEMLAKAGVRLAVAGSGAEAPSPAATPDDEAMRMAARHCAPDAASLAAEIRAYGERYDRLGYLRGSRDDKYSALAASLGCDPMDSHDGRLETARRLRRRYECPSEAERKAVEAARADERRRALEESAKECEAARRDATGTTEFSSGYRGASEVIASRIRALAHVGKGGAR